jgi:hypothetical protein
LTVALCELEECFFAFDDFARDDDFECLLAREQLTRPRDREL